MTETSKAYHDQEHRLHRDDGPALIRSNGERRYYRHGLLHRLDGPALVSATTPENDEY